MRNVPREKTTTTQAKRSFTRQFDTKNYYTDPLPAHIASTFSFMNKSTTKFETANKQK
jgi:hypothetical protein